MESSSGSVLIALSAGDFMPGIYQALFWSFLVAALIWLVLWLLLRDGGNGDAPEPAMASASAPGIASEDEPLPEIATVTPERAADAYRAELDGGAVRQDDVLSILYNNQPEDVDDLKRISGVAKVLEKRLHDSDVYRFKQIAFWTDSAAAEFSKMLRGFKDRIYREDWISQAKQLHEEKYGEKL